MMANEQKEELWVFPQPTERNKDRIHIFSGTRDKLLCGNEITQNGNATVCVDKRWIDQADPDQVVCLLCRKIAEKLNIEPYIKSHIHE